MLRISPHRGFPGQGSNRGPLGVGATVGLADGLAADVAAAVAVDVAPAEDGADDDRTPMSRTVSPQLETTRASANNVVSGRTFTAYRWITTISSPQCCRTRNGQATSYDEAWPPRCDYLLSVRTLSVPRITELEVPASVASGLFTCPVAASSSEPCTLMVW